MDDRVGELARRLLSLETSNLDSAVAIGLETLGHGLSADCTSFYLLTPGTDSFVAIAHWDRSGSCSADSAEPISIDLACLPGLGAKLRTGKASKSSGAIAFRKVVENVRPMAMWSSAQTNLYVPCVSPDGLLGFFKIEAGVAASRWSDALVGQASLAGSLMSNFIERHRLAAELDSIRLRQGQDERLETLGRVASSVAHDFNNVLTAILGYADLLEMELSEKNSGQRELHEIRDAANRAEELVEQVLAFGRPRRAGIESLDLAEALSKLEGMLQRVVGEDTRVEFSIVEGLDPIAVDPGRFERVILNLASNARDALMDKSNSLGHFELAARSVTIDAEGCDSSQNEDDPPCLFPELRPGRYVRLTARDNGSGIDPALHERIFEPFFTTKGSGTGLGLATVSEVLREAHGAIRIETAPGLGTSFHLYFPV